MSQIKDKKISVYVVKTDRDIWDHEIKVKQYIHDRNRLWAYVRELSEREKFTAKASGAEQSTVFKVCYNTKLVCGQYLEFNEQTYRIESIDGFEFYKRDLTIRANRCIPEVTDCEKYDE